MLVSLGLLVAAIDRSTFQGLPPLNAQDRARLAQMPRAFAASGKAGWDDDLFQDDDGAPLPPAFDAREAWPGCIGPVLDQGTCGSCWAVSSVAVMSDRLCIERRATNASAAFVQLSALQVVACDRGAGEKGGDKGCEGGQPYTAFDFAQDKGGLVPEACAPYLKSGGGPIDTCADEPCLAFQDTPACPARCPLGLKSCFARAKCAAGGAMAGARWGEAAARLEQSYMVQLSRPMAREIAAYGPIVATMTVFEDLLNYTGGVYRHTSGAPAGAHAVKIIGWGSEPEPYWLVQNSWTERWGEKGYFRIARGDTECECDICNLCTAGLFSGNHSALSPPPPADAARTRSLPKTASASSSAADALVSAKNAYRYARQHVVDQDERNCGWTRSTYMLGLWEYYAATVEATTPDLDAKGDLADWGGILNYSLCQEQGQWTGPCATENASSCADNQLPGATFIELYKAGLDRPAPHAEATLRSITAQFDAEIALGSATEGSWPIVDLTFMAIAPLARLGAVTGESRYFEKMWANWNASMLMARVTPPRTPRGAYGLFNQSAKLFMRDDTNLWHDGFWGRGNGWAMLGLVDAIRFGDAGAVAGGIADPHRESYIAVFKLFASRLLELQGKDGAWRSSMLEAETFPTPEATGSACFTRGLAFGVNAGLLDASTYIPAVNKAWDFLSRTALQPSGRVGYCQHAGGVPTNDSAQLNANSTSDFCVGLLLGAAAEVSRLSDR